MKIHYACWLTFLCCTFSTVFYGQIPCDPNGNVIIYSNYDGGYLNINVDDNIPNLKIGILSYEPSQVTFSGTYAGNITEVRFITFSPGTGGNFHCNNNITTSTVTGVNPNIVSIVGPQSATLPDPNGNPNIICSYDCANTNSGGCNTAQQVQHYFQTYFSGNYRKHFTQYGCWCGTYDISQVLSNCCGAPVSSGNAPPVITPSNPFFCQGGSVNLTASGYSSYSWSPATGLNTTSGPNVTASPSTTTTYTVTSNGPCGVATAQVTVTVIPPAVVPITVVPPSATICDGDTITLTASGVNSFTWSPATGLSGTSGSTVSAFPSTTTTYTITGNDPCTTATGSVTITVNPSQNIPMTITPPSDTICPGGQVTLSVPGNFTNVLWTPGGSLNTTSGNTVIATPGVTTTYTATGNDNCNTGTGTSTIVVLNAPNPTAAFTNTINGFTVNFTNISTGGTTYAWSFGDGNTSTVFSPSHTYLNPGTYSVTLIVSNACGSDTITREVTVPNTTGLPGTDLMQSIPVYLQGNQVGSIAIPLHAKDLTTQLMDMKGRTLYSGILNTTSISIDQFSLSAGIYVLQITDGDNNGYRLKIRIQ